MRADLQAEVSSAQSVVARTFVFTVGAKDKLRDSNTKPADIADTRYLRHPM
jgi:hypothetical protein